MFGRNIYINLRAIWDQAEFYLGGFGGGGGEGNCILTLGGFGGDGNRITTDGGLGAVG